MHATHAFSHSITHRFGLVSTAISVDASLRFDRPEKKTNNKKNTVLYISKMEAEIWHKLFFQRETKIRHRAAAAHTAAQTDPLLRCIVNRQRLTRTTTTAANLSLLEE